MHLGCPGTPAIVWALAGLGGVALLFAATLAYQLGAEWTQRRWRR